VGQSSGIRLEIGTSVPGCLVQIAECSVGASQVFVRRSELGGGGDRRFRSSTPAAFPGYQALQPDLRQVTRTIGIVPLAAIA
jgi:hypothetical protein